MEGERQRERGREGERSREKKISERRERKKKSPNEREIKANERLGLFGVLVDEVMCWCALAALNYLCSYELHRARSWLSKTLT